MRQQVRSVKRVVYLYSRYGEQCSTAKLTDVNVHDFDGLKNFFFLQNFLKIVRSLPQVFVAVAVCF